MSKVQLEKPMSAIEEAKDLVRQLKDAKEENMQILMDIQAAIAEKKLSGSADAGQVPEEPKEETAQEYAEKVMRGEYNDRS